MPTNRNNDYDGPEHLDPRPLGRLSRKLWKKMSNDQREDWLYNKEAYQEALREERRQERLKKRGY